MRPLFSCIFTAVVMVAASGPVAAQISLPGGVAQQTPRLQELPAGPAGLDAMARDQLQQGLLPPARLRVLVRQSGGVLEADPAGWPVVRGELVAVDLSPDGRRRALQAGFTVMREERLAALDMVATVLAPPQRLSLRRALQRLRNLDPEGDYDFNHVHAPAGALAEAGAGPARVNALPGGRGRIGLIDTGVDASHPAMAASRIVQRGFAGPARAAPHGTAVASLIVGRSGHFSGAAPGAALYVADVYGGAPSGGSSTGLARALAWMAENYVPVVNVSLVGPRNAVIEAAIRRASGHGMLIIAAVGNDGPSAPPLYPAAYADVLGVTAVNGRGRVLPEAGRGPQVDFAAPGADMAAAGSGQGYVNVRGSSFAAPLVAGLLARELLRPDRDGASAAVTGLARTARDAGVAGRDPVYGVGIVATDRRVEPRTVGARGRLRR